MNDDRPLEDNVESTTRTPRDIFHFTVTVAGIVLGIGGVITSSVAASVCALVMIFFGLAYFALNLAED
ncbi:MAG TPA: hypothetical protein VN873_08320 [Candidatus Angelobacter sp.]|nr:hypothetical protein [Candidatus Angelobacter sp.]